MKCLLILVLYYGQNRKIQGAFIALFIISYAFVILYLSMQRWNIVNRGAEAFCWGEELIAMDMKLIRYVVKIVIWSKASTGESREEHTVSPDEKSQCHKGSKIKRSIQEGGEKKIHLFEVVFTSIPNAPFFAFLVLILSVAAVLWEGLVLQYPHFHDSHGSICSCKVQKSWWFHVFNRSRQAFELLCAWTKLEFTAFITDLIQLPMKSAGVFPFKSVGPLRS